MANSKINFAVSIMNTASDIAYKASELADLLSIYFDRGYNAGGADPITDDDLIGQNIDAATIASFVTFADNFGLFLNNGTPAQGDYDATINKARNDK